MAAPASSPWRRGASRLLHGGPGAVTLAVYVLMFAPIVVLIAFSFNAAQSTVVWTGFSLDWYRDVLDDRNLGRALRVSLVVAAASAVVATAVGALAAIAIVRRHFPGRDLLATALASPLVLPEIVLAVGLLVFLSFIHAPLGYGSLIVGHVLVTIPFTTLIVRAAASALDPRVEEAAADLGADAWQALWRVTLPQLAPALLTSLLLAATLSFDNFVMSTFTTGVGTTTLPLRIYSSLKLGITPEINALGALMILANVAVVLVVMGRYLTLLLPSRR